MLACSGLYEVNRLWCERLTMKDFMSGFRQSITRLRRNKFLSGLLPFVVFVVGGSFALKEFASVRYEFRQVNRYELPETLTKVDLEVEAERAQKLALRDWDNKRISRPWESNTNVSSEKQ